MISCLVAVDQNQGIGFKGKMPWPHLTGDMKWFKHKTQNQIIIMGRKTWDSIGARRLPNRINIVLSNSNITNSDYCFSDHIKVLDYCKSTYPLKEIYIIGGSTIYQQYMNFIDKFYITEIEAQYKSDTFFDLTYVQKNFTKVIEHAMFTEPIKYIIKEYHK